MKKRTILSCLAFVFALTIQLDAAISITAPTPNAANESESDHWLSTMDTETFLALSPKEIQEKTGQKLKFKDRMAIRLAQKQVRKAMKKGEATNLEEAFYAGRRGFSLGGFLLGFFLGPIGVLLAVLFGANAFRSSLIGLLCAIIVWAIVVFA